MNFTGITDNTRYTSEKPLSFTAEGASAAFEVDKVTYTIAGESPEELTPVDGKYTLTTDILAKAAGKNLTIDATAKAKVFYNVDAGSVVLIDNKPVTSADGNIYISSGDDLTVLVQAGKIVTVTNAVKGTDYKDCARDESADKEGYHAYTITDITGNITIKVN